ncbi:putative membrane protein DUF2142 [Frigoribacterium sp. PhB160]|uniref:glycosyltransferase family 39 protein n=1 Tax=Frigoribacterium sp. PhB160 TaxID=2485192 RepID=UPI000FBF094E|nr:DUF2142 domain-containing protein [Frigoribacterium sp. PhB160]ROS61816.1 putative membrane protein DUF2142 [Frigoribacterium sp. PhB160]
MSGTRASEAALVPARAAAPAASRPERVVVAVVTAAFALLLTLWAVLTPMFEAPDEFTHWDAAVRLALDEGWPPPGEAQNLAASELARVTNYDIPPADRSSYGTLLEAAPGDHDFVNQMTQHPPTYYALAGAVLDAVDFTHHRWDLGVLALRLLSVALVAPLPLLTWATVRRLTRSPRTAIVAATTLLAVPQLAQIGSSVTSDAPIILLGAVTVWLTTRTITGDRTWRTHLALGTALGLALATKGTAFPAIPFVALALLLGDTTLPLARRALRTLAVGATTAALGAWWWIHNLTTTGTLQPNGLIEQRPPTPWPAGEGPDLGVFTATFWDGVSSSFWGQLGRAKFPISPIVSDSLTVVALLVVACWAFRRVRGGRAVVLLAVLPVVIAAAMLGNGWNTYDQTQGVYGVQGRYLYPALVVLVALSAVAWRRLAATAPGRRRTARTAVVLAPALAAYGLWVAVSGFFPGTVGEPASVGTLTVGQSLPVPAAAFAVLAAVVAVAVVTACTLVWRAVGRVSDPPASATTAAAADAPSC